jgi:hypothetical protein
MGTYQVAEECMDCFTSPYDEYSPRGLALYSQSCCRSKLGCHTFALWHNLRSKLWECTSGAPLFLSHYPSLGDPPDTCCTFCFSLVFGPCVSDTDFYTRQESHIEYSEVPWDGGGRLPIPVRYRGL